MKYELYKMTANQVTVGILTRQLSPLAHVKLMDSICLKAQTPW